MALYKYLRQVWKKPSETLKEETRERLLKFRREEVTVRLERPTRLDRARSLGYKAKQGIFVVRQRVARGGHTRPKRQHGRRTKTMRRKLVLNMNYQQIAEGRACKKYPNCEVLGSYPVVKDGKHAWYEIILVDIAHPAIKKDAHLKWITKGSNKDRVGRGLTSAAKKARGLRNKGIGAEKFRPSRQAASNRGGRKKKHL